MRTYGLIRGILYFSPAQCDAVVIQAQRSLHSDLLAVNSSALQLLRASYLQRAYSQSTLIMPKRKSVSKAVEGPAFSIAPIPIPNFEDDQAPPLKRRASQRKVSQPKPNTGSTNPDKNANVLDAPEALRASPDASEPDERLNVAEAGMDVDKQVKDEDVDDSPLSDAPEVEPEPKTKAKKPTSKAQTKAAPEKDGKGAAKPKPTAAAKEKKETTKEPQFLDPEAEGNEEADEEEIQAALSRPPPVNSDYLPLPWKGRLGYVRLLRINPRERTDHL